MKNKIICLTDYKGSFGQKWKDIPYRSGMDKELIKKYFSEKRYEVSFKPFSEIDLNSPEINECLFLYTSSEDVGYFYKNFIEDVVLAIQEKGGKIIPEYKFVRANNNKVFMEYLRNILSLPGNGSFKSYQFGTMEEALNISGDLQYPAVFKLAEGSGSRNVELVKNRKELSSAIMKYGRTRNFKKDLRDIGRAVKRKGYKKESLYRKKFIVQSFIPHLKNDWKIYVYYDKYFIFYRPIHKHRVFKASGGGYDNYFFGKNANIADGIFDFAEKVYKSLNVPNVSLDIGFDGRDFYLFEFQCIYFGTAGIIYSDEYFVKHNNAWTTQSNEKNIEKVYVESIVGYLKERNL